MWQLLQAFLQTNKFVSTACSNLVLLLIDNITRGSGQQLTLEGLERAILQDIDIICNTWQVRFWAKMIQGHSGHQSGAASACN